MTVYICNNLSLYNFGMNVYHLLCLGEVFSSEASLSEACSSLI